MTLYITCVPTPPPLHQEYKDYLLLKDKMDSIQAEVSLLSDQLESLPHNSPEVKVRYYTQ